MKSMKQLLVLIAVTFVGQPVVGGQQLQKMRMDHYSKFMNQNQYQIITTNNTINMDWARGAINALRQDGYTQNKDIALFLWQNIANVVNATANLPANRNNVEEFKTRIWQSLERTVNEVSTQQQIPAPQVQKQGHILTVPQPGVFPAAPSPQQPVQQKTPVPAQQAQQTTPTASRLFNFNFGAGGVLPTFVKNGKKYLILSREAGGNDKGTYDDFGGKRDFIGNNKKETPPMITAAREFFEEAILKLSVGMSLQETQNFINEDNRYTEFVIANGHNVTYITDFTTYADKFFANFYRAYKTTTDRHSREKNSIAIVGWDELKKVVSNTSFNEGVIIDAEVLNPTDLKWYKEKITLRPFFVKKFRPFWMDKPYQKDINSKVRFY